MHLGLRLMYYCVALSTKAVSDVICGVDVGASAKSKILLTNQGTVAELLCGVFLRTIFPKIYELG